MKKYHMFMGEDYQRAGYELSFETLKAAMSWADDGENQCWYNRVIIKETQQDGSLEDIAWRSFGNGLFGSDDEWHIDEKETTT